MPRGDGRSVALVTGVASGIGAAVATALADEGMVVAGVDLDADTASKHCTPYIADVTNADVVNDVVSTVENDLGPIETLVNVAGVLVNAPVHELSEQDWSRCFDVNATGVFLVSQSVSRRMADRERGCIVTVGSNAASVPRSGMAAYAASKAASAQFTRCLGLELAPKGIRCNLVAPGSTETPMLHSMWTESSGRQQTVNGDPARFRLGIPLGRIAEPDDIAEAVLFLASERARHITMHELYVDGGATLGV